MGDRTLEDAFPLLTDQVDALMRSSISRPLSRREIQAMNSSTTIEEMENRSREALSSLDTDEFEKDVLCELPTEDAAIWTGQNTIRVITLQLNQELESLVQGLQKVRSMYQDLNQSAMDQNEWNDDLVKAASKNSYSIVQTLQDEVEALKLKIRRWVLLNDMRHKRAGKPPEDFLHPETKIDDLVEEINKANQRLKQQVAASQKAAAPVPSSPAPVPPSPTTTTAGAPAPLPVPIPNVPAPSSTTTTASAPVPAPIPNVPVPPSSTTTGTGASGSPSPRRRVTFSPGGQVPLKTTKAPGSLDLSKNPKSSILKQPSSVDKLPRPVRFIAIKGGALHAMKVTNYDEARKDGSCNMVFVVDPKWTINRQTTPRNDPIGGTPEEIISGRVKPAYISDLPPFFQESSQRPDIERLAIDNNISLQKFNNYHPAIDKPNYVENVFFLGKGNADEAILQWQAVASNDPELKGISWDIKSTLDAALRMVDYSKFQGGTELECLDRLSVFLRNEYNAAIAQRNNIVDPYDIGTLLSVMLMIRKGNELQSVRPTPDRIQIRIGMDLLLYFTYSLSAASIKAAFNSVFTNQRNGPLIFDIEPLISLSFLTHTGNVDDPTKNDGANMIYMQQGISQSPPPRFKSFLARFLNNGLLKTIDFDNPGIDIIKPCLTNPSDIRVGASILLTLCWERWNLEMESRSIAAYGQDSVILDIVTAILSFGLSYRPNPMHFPHWAPLTRK